MTDTQQWESDLWTTETGLEEEFTATIVDGKFGYDNQIQNGERLLFMADLRKEADNGAVTEQQQFFGCGKGWETRDGGLTATREDKNTKRRFHQNCAMGLLVDSLREVAMEKGVEDQLRARGLPNQVAMWKGLKLHFVNKQFKAKIDGDDVKYNRLIIDDIVDMGKGGGSKASAKKEKAEAATGELDSAVVKKLRRLAEDTIENGGDHDAFIEAAYANGVVEVDDAAATEAVTNSGAGSIWAEAGGQ